MSDSTPPQAADSDDDSQYEPVLPGRPGEAGLVGRGGEALDAAAVAGALEQRGAGGDAARAHHAVRGACPHDVWGQELEENAGFKDLSGCFSCLFNVGYNASWALVQALKSGDRTESRAEGH